MSTKTVLAWLAAAIVFGLGALWIIRRGNTPPTATSDVVPGGELICGFDLHALTGMTIEHPGGAVQSLERDASSRWFMRVSENGPPSEANPSWPVLVNTLQGSLHLISTAVSSGVPAQDATVGEQATLVALTFSDGSRRSLRLATRTMGGAGLVEITAPDAGGSDRTRLALTADVLHRVFKDPSPRAWRSRATISEVGPKFTTITLEAGDKRISLGNAGGHWFLNEPLVAPASDATVSSLVTTLNALAIEDYLDGRSLDLKTMGLDAPAASVTVEAPPATDSGTNKTTVRFGGPSDASGKMLFALALDPPRAIAVDATALASIPMDPVRYVRKFASGLQPADIRLIEFLPTRDGARKSVFRRDLKNWVDQLPDGREEMLSDADIRDIEGSLIILTTMEPATVLVGSPKDIQISGDLIVHSDSRAVEPESMRIGRLGGSENAPEFLVILQGEVARTYPFARVTELLRRLSLGRDAAPQQPDEDPNK